MQQDIEREEIVDRTDGPDRDHEIANEGHVPATKCTDVGRVYVVGRDGNLRGVVEEVVEKDLRWQHRQKWKKDGRARHAEHIPKVRDGTHQEILHDVCRGAASLDDSLMQDVQPWLEQDDVGGFARHVDCRGNGYAHIGGVQRRRIVNPVSHVAHDVSPLLEGMNDAALLQPRFLATKPLR